MNIKNYKPIVIIDSREQTPWSFDCETITDTLDTGDYSLVGFKDFIRIERKSLPDFIGCCGKGRDRFKRELQRLRSFKCKAVFIECDIKDIYNGNWRQYKDYLKKCKEHAQKGLTNPPVKCIIPNHVISAINSWRNTYGIEFVYCGSTEFGAKESLKYMVSWVNNAYSFYERFDKIIKEMEK